jgi:parallel beta-helix repeat protein
MNKKLYLLLLMALSLPLAMMAQTAVIVDGDNPFSDDFEGTTCDWEFVNGTSANAWYWGTATNNGGTHAVYISNDGGENYTYTTSTSSTWVYFSKLITLEEASYRFTYDWRCYGEGSYDHIRVGLVPGSTELTHNGGIPSGWISLHSESYLCGNSNWSTKSYNAIITAAGNYKLVFAWKNDGGGGSNPPGAIDNVSIEELVIDNHTYLTQTTDADFIKGTGSNVNIADSRVSMQYKMASVADWAATTNLPQNLRDHQVVTWRNYVYCVGGINGSTPRNNVYRATQQDNGISGWTELNALPVALRDMGVIATQNQLVVMGGRNNDTVSDKIYSAAINDDGSIGAWEELSISLPQPCWGLRAVEALGNIYIIGGANTDTENDATDKAYRLTLNAMGEVTGITEVNSLPEARNGHAVAVYNSKIIVTGGYDATFTQKNTVYCAAVNLDGSLGTWTTQTALPNAVYGHTTICTNGILTIIGGMEGTLASNKFVYTDADATAYDWQLSDILLPERYTEGASFAFGNKIFFCGGMNISNNLNNAVRYMAVTTSDTPANHPVFVSWPFNVGTPKVMDELNYTLTNTSSYTYEILYRTADEDMVFSNWTSAGTNLPTTVNQTKSFIQYMFRITATGEDDFAINDVTLTLSGCSQLAGNLDWIGSLTAEHSPYLVTETISFTSGTHNIGPGVTIMFMPNTGMNIGAASVNFNGTEESPILLTAYEAGIGSWNGVYYQDASDNNGITSVMEYTTIEKAGNGDNHSNLRMYYTSQPSVINHCSFNQSSVDGMYCYYTGEVPTLTNCTFDSNVRRGLFLDYNSPLTCTSCTMSNNYDGLYIYYSAPTFNDCTMTGNTNCGISLAEESYNAIYTGVTCSDNLYGLYSYTPDRSFNFDESTIAFASNGSDVAVGGGGIGSDRTWNNYANGYALLGDVSVQGYYYSPKLTIVPGTTIKVKQNCGLYVGYYSYYYGMLYAVGTAEAPITFTSLNGEAGGWTGLYFRDGSDSNSSSSLRYCVVENAVINLHCEYTNQPSVMYSTFQNATNHNVYVYQASPSLEGCTLKNAPRGLSVDYYSQPTMVSVVFENHSDACVRYYNNDNTSVTYSNCTMKDSQYGIYYATPNRDFAESANVTFENNIANIALAGGNVYTHTWEANTYAVLDNIYIREGTLTLSPGAVLKFAENKYPYVNNYGNLIAEGTATQPITFTSLNGEVGGWNGLRFYDGSDYNSDQHSSLKHCIFEKGNDFNLYMEYTNQPALIENCTFRNSAAKGVSMYDSYNTFSNCTFEDNAQYPLYYNNAHYVGVLEDLTFTGNQYDVIAVNGGDIEADRTWNVYTYYILNNLYVGGYYGNYNTYHFGLTLLPGTTLKFAEGKYMYIGNDSYNCGDLHAEGTAEQPIVFTSINGEPGGWNGMRFHYYSRSNSEQHSELKHCIVENGNGFNLYLEDTNQPSLIENCLFQNSNGYGLHYYYYTSNTVSKTTIRNNASHGIYMNYCCSPVIGGSTENACSIYNNGGYAVYLDYNYNSNTNLNMSHNFWGTISSQTIDNEMIYDKLDNSNNGRVIFEPVSWFPVDSFEQLQGTFAYGEDKVMANSEMNIISETDSIMATATTNGSGVYDFSNYAVGVYNTLDDDFGVDILAGVNATDALLAMRHFVHLDTLAPNYAAVADVNGNGSINGTDAMLIMRRAIDGQFPNGDFYFYNPNGISVEGNTCTYDLSFLCYGDVNGSYNPATRDNSIELMTEGQLIADSYQEVEMPVSIKQAIEMGALTLYFGYPEEYLEIEDVVLAATGESLVFSATEGKLTAVWFSLNPVVLAENDVLINIKVHTRDLSNIDEPVAFTLEAYSELADGSANVIEDVVIAMPAIITETLGMSDNATESVRLSVYPNPVKDVCTMTYELAEAGHVTVSIYNMMGVKVMDVADFRQESGQHEMRLSTESLAAGMYSCRITFEGESSWVKTTKLIIEK